MRRTAKNAARKGAIVVEEKKKREYGCDITEISLQVGPDDGYYMREREANKKNL